MARYYDSFWFRSSVLLLALAAGFAFTQFVPTYEEIAAAREQPADETPRAQANGRISSEVTEKNLDQSFRNAT